jgi:carbon-monoxide dehydrogenase medium subunit
VADDPGRDEDAGEDVMNPFAFHRPRTLAEALGILRSSKEAKLLAGGQSLIPILKLGLAQPTDLVTLHGVEEVRGIRKEDGAIVVGAGVTHGEVAASEAVRKAIPALAVLAGSIGDAQVRNRGTLGGSIAHSDPAADYPAALVGLSATVVTDRREIAAGDFFQGMFATVLAADEIIVAVRFPIPDAAGYAKFANPASRFAIVGVMVARKKDEVRVAVTGAAASVLRIPAMEDALAAKFGAAAVDAVTISADELVSDMHAAADYRAHLVGVMARRAVAACG